MFFVVEVFTQVTKCFFEVRGLIRQPAHARLGDTYKLLYTSARRPPPQRPSSHGGPPGPQSSKIRVADDTRIKLLTELASREESASASQYQSTSRAQLTRRYADQTAGQRTQESTETRAGLKKGQSESSASRGQSSLSTSSCHR